MTITNMETVTGILVVFGTSFLELWAGIPIGLALKLNPFITGKASALGAISASVLVLSLGDNLRKKFFKWRYGGKKDLKKGKYYKIWNKYGIVGLGLLSPLFFGAPLGSGLGIVLGAEKRPLLIWMGIGIILWSILLTTAGYFGIMVFESAEFFNF